VRSFRTNARIRSLTTGTFNRVVKDPNRLPPERRAFSSRRTHYESESGCPRNFLTISFARNPVNLHIPQHLHMISTCGKCRNCTRGAGSTFQSFEGFRVSRSLKPWNFATLKLRRSLQRATVWPSALDLQRADFSAHAEAEDRKLRKDLTLEVLALKVPFRNLLVFPNQVPWPGQLRTLRCSLNS
jgi:hypothetical protein